MRARSAYALSGALALAAWPFAEPQLPVLRRRDVPVLPTGAPRLTVLHLSDLHLLGRHRRRAAWVRALGRLRPDLVVSTGDHLSAMDALPLLLHALGGFDAPAVFVPGNNDYYQPVRPRPQAYLCGGGPLRRAPDLPWSQVAAGLRSVGWTDLTSRRTVVELRGLPVTLTGTDDAHLRRDHYALVAGPVDGLGLGLTHTPQRRLLDAFAGDGHALVLAGHTHGGQLRLPLAGAVVTNCDLSRSRARGLSRSGAGWLHVSAGLGTSPYLPVRLCCRPEATLLTLVPADPRGAGGPSAVR